MSSNLSENETSRPTGSFNWVLQLTGQHGSRYISHVIRGGRSGCCFGTLLNSILKERLNNNYQRVPLWVGHGFAMMAKRGQGDNKNYRRRVWIMTK